MSNVDEIMEQVQVFASAWSLVGGIFDNGNMLTEAEEAKSELRKMIEALAQPAQEAEPVDQSKLDDMAWAEFEWAMSGGVSVDSFKRLAAEATPGERKAVTASVEEIQRIAGIHPNREKCWVGCDAYKARKACDCYPGISTEAAVRMYKACEKHFKLEAKLAKTEWLLRFYIW